MAEYRTIRMSFWNDPYIEELCAEEKLLYLYLFTSPHTNNLGILEVTRRKVAFESGLSPEAVNKGIARFEADGKAVIDGNMLWLTNFIKNQTSTSKKLVQGLRLLLLAASSEKIRKKVLERYPALFGGVDAASKAIPMDPDDMDTLSIPSPCPMDTPSNGMDTLSIPSGEKEEEREREKENTKNSIERSKNLDRARARRGAQAVVSGTDFPVLPDSPLSPPPEPCTGTGNEPSLEFLELRAAYSERVRSEGEMTGFVEYKQAKAARDWPGLNAILDDIDKRLTAGLFHTNYGPSLRKYLTERYWKAPIRPLASPRAPQGRARDAPGQTLTERNAATARQVLAELEAEHGD